MISDELLQFLVCPETRSRLAIGDQALLDKLNRAIARRSLKNKAGRTLDAVLDGALVREDGDIAYPVVDQIPLMLADEAIRLSQLEGD